ncbi:MAG: hypothetical protein KBT13_07900 [Bacteroidales bacterium]|nr:hypothetical protein [Candidatus Sodaliphilus limicaballi]
MIKKLLFIALMLIAVMAFNSCSKDDDPAEFKFYETYNEWGSNGEQVREKMGKLGWTYNHKKDNEYFFEIKDKNVECTAYVHPSYGLLKVSVYYNGMNRFYDNIKSLLTERYKITWTAMPNFEKGTSANTDLDATMWTFTHKTEGESVGYILEPHDLI